MEILAALLLVGGAAGAGRWLGQKQSIARIGELEARVAVSAIADTRRYLISMLWWVGRTKDRQPAGAQPMLLNYPQVDVATVGDAELVLDLIDVLAELAAVPPSRRLTADEWTHLKAMSRRLESALTEQEALIATGRPMNAFSPTDAQNLAAQLEVVLREVTAPFVSSSRAA